MKLILVTPGGSHTIFSGGVSSTHDRLTLVGAGQMVYLSKVIGRYAGDSAQRCKVYTQVEDPLMREVRSLLQSLVREYYPLSGDNYHAYIGNAEIVCEYFMEHFSDSDLILVLSVDQIDSIISWIVLDYNLSWSNENSPLIPGSGYVINKARKTITKITYQD